MKKKSIKEWYIGNKNGLSGYELYMFVRERLREYCENRFVMEMLSEKSVSECR